MKTELGKYFVDISKLVFGGVVLSQILNVTENKTILIVLGITASVIFALLGFIILNRTNND